MTRVSRTFFCASTLWICGATALAGQGLTSGTVFGAVRSPDGRGVPGTAVTLRPSEVLLARDVMTGPSGGFEVQFVEEGTYQLIVEALGYRPLVIQDVIVSGGEKVRVDAVIQPEPPPVMAVDTIRYMGGTVTPWRRGGIAIPAPDLISDRFSDLGSLGSLSSQVDPFGGSQGLPGDMTLLVADGVPFFRAPAPLVRGQDLSWALLPASAVTEMTVLADATDIQWTGATGGFLSVAPRSGAPRGPELSATWSGDPLWTSSVLDYTSPTFTSFTVGGRASVSLVPDTSRLLVAGEYLREQTPLPPRISEAQAGALSGLDADLLGGLTAPALESVTRASGMARVNYWGESRRLSLTAAGSRVERELDGAGPGVPRYGSGLPGTSTDLLVSGHLTSTVNERVDAEVMVGVSASRRRFVEGVGLDPATVLAQGIALGAITPLLTEASRLDMNLTPLVHGKMGPGTAKAGLSVRAANHTLTGDPSGLAESYFSDAAALSAGRGYFVRSTMPEASFSTSEIGTFVQYEWEAAPGAWLTAGARIDQERIPASEVTANTAWAGATAIVNDSFPASFSQVGFSATLDWDVRNDGLTKLFATVGLRGGDMDPRLVWEAFTADGAASKRRYLGSGVSWPDATPGAGATDATPLTILGPDTRPPRTSEASFGINQRLSGGWSLHVGGAVRRTDFLTRRRDLNLPLFPFSADQHGRDIVGDLEKDGSMVQPIPGRNRRFAAFDNVWALDPDGWSEYRGASVGLSYLGDRGEFFASYTRSETRDNWVGAASGYADAALRPRLPGDRSGWDEGISDFDVPERFAAALRLPLAFLPGSSVKAVYHFQSGLPFTPGYRAGVDVNGDGSSLNDVAFVPDAGSLAGLQSAWPCLSDQVGTFAERNSCRRPATHNLDLKFAVDLGGVGNTSVQLTIEGFNLLEDDSGILDEALLLVDPDQELVRGAGGDVITIPVTVNPDFGRVVFPTSPGRILRVGLRIGG